MDENDDRIDVQDLSDDEEVDMENIEEVPGGVAVNDLDFIAEYAATEWSFSAISTVGLQGAEMPEQLMVVDAIDDVDDGSEDDDDHGDIDAVADVASESSSDSGSDDSYIVVESSGNVKSDQWCTEEEVLVLYWSTIDPPVDYW